MLSAFGLTNRFLSVATINSVSWGDTLGTNGMMMTTRVELDNR